MSARPSRKLSEDSLTSFATPDVIRSTVLSLIPHAKLADDKKKALILQVQKSDFTQPSVIEYFIGIVGVKSYETALRSTQSQSISAAPAAQASSTVPSATKQVTGKAYCHGGDVAFFSGIDLDFERVINSALHAKRRRRPVSTSLESVVPQASVEIAIANKLNRVGGFTYDEKYVAAVHRALCRMGGSLIEKLALQNNAKKILTSQDLLEVVRRLNDSRELPVQFTAKWEQRVIDQVVLEHGKGFSTLK